jgi:hypothetical protein
MFFKKIIDINNLCSPQKKTYIVGYEKKKL